MTNPAHKRHHENTPIKVNEVHVERLVVNKKGRKAKVGEVGKKSFYLDPEIIISLGKIKPWVRETQGFTTSETAFVNAALGLVLSKFDPNNAESAIMQCLKERAGVEDEP